MNISLSHPINVAVNGWRYDREILKRIAIFFSMSNMLLHIWLNFFTFSLHFVVRGMLSRVGDKDMCRVCNVWQGKSALFKPLDSQPLPPFAVTDDNILEARSQVFIFM